MNYLISWCVCVGMSVMTVMGGYDNYYWLIQSDINVTIFLILAWAIGRNKPVKTQLVINVN